MELGQIIPLLIPAGTFQLFMQIYTIKQIWNQDVLSEKKKILWIILVILLNLIAVSVFFFLYYPKEQKNYSQDTHPYFRFGVLAFILIAFNFFVIQLLILDPEGIHATSVIWLSTFIYMGLILFEVLVTYNKPHFIGIVGLIVFLFALALEYESQSEPIQLMGLITLTSILNVLPSKWHKKLFIGIVLSYLSFLIFKSNSFFGGWQSDKSIAFIYTNTLLFVMVYLTYSSLKKLMLNNQNLHYLVDQLENQSKSLEEMTAIAERGRMANEIHDHVGHTLTTAIIQLESLIPLVDEHDTLVKSRIEMSKEQVRLGLNEIRALVKGVDVNLSLPFETNLQLLIEKTRASTSLAIHLEMEGKIALIPIKQRILLSAFKEFVTNAIKHGKATEVHALVTSNHDTLEFVLSNNGKPESNVIYGYGLTQMASSISSIGGWMKVSSSEDIGFVLYIKLPMGEDIYE